MTTPTPDELRSWRQRLGLTQEEAAAALPCSVHGLRKWEQGGRAPPDYLWRAMRDVERDLTRRARERAGEGAAKE